MFIRATCVKCGSRDVHHYKVLPTRLEQYCRCGQNQTRYQLRKPRRKPKSAIFRKFPVYKLTFSIWAIASVIAYSFTPAPITYASEPIVSLPSIFIETLVQKIDRVADANGIARWKLHALAQCESSMNPKAKNVNKREISHGLFQINLMAHDVTVQQAQDPDFALAFVVKHWGKRYNMWYNCSRKNSL